MENLLIKAIKQFKKENKGAEFRTCYVAECSNNKNKVINATFRFEFVTKENDEYQECYITVSKD